MDIKEGTIAVNNNTGEEIVFLNGEWTPNNGELESTNVFADRRKAFVDGVKNIPQAVVENLDVPGSIAGAVSGGRAGIPGGPAGVAAGTIIGGGLGAFGGSAASSAIKEGEVDFTKAAKDAGVSMAFDAVTLGAGKLLIKPLAEAIGVSPSSIFNKLFGKAPDAEDINKALPPAPTSGTPESLIATQELLEKGGGTLLASQTKNASRMRNLAETISSVGILSKGRLASIAEKNNIAITKEIDKQIAGIDPALANTPGDLGQHVFEIIGEGRKLISSNFDVGLTRLTKKFGRSEVRPEPLLRVIDDFLAKNTTDGLSELSEKTLAVIQRTKENLIGPENLALRSKGIGPTQLPKITVDKTFVVQKLLNSDVKDFGTFGSGNFSTLVDRELAQLSGELRQGIDKSLTSVDPQLGIDFRAINKKFGDATNALLPKINQTIITNADKVDYDKIGNLLVGNGSVGRIKALMGSIDTAFAQAKGAGVPIKSSIKNAAQAKQMVRQSYIFNTFGNTDGVFDPLQWANKAKSFEKNPNELAKMKVILGEDGFNSFKRLTNAIVDSSSRPAADAFTLMLRAKETGATIGLVGVGVATSFVNLAGAVAVFTVPDILGRVATNKLAVNRLLLLNSSIKKNPDIKAEVVVAQVAKVLDALSEGDKEAIADSIDGFL